LKLFEQLSLVLTYAGIVQGFFVALLLNSRSVKRSRANIFLSVLLISLSFSIAHIRYAGQVLTHLSVKVYSIGDPTFFLIAPFLWLYATELTGDRVKMSWKIVLHFLPFLLIVFISLFFQSTRTDEVINALKGHRIGSVLFWIVLFVQFSGYLYFTNKRWTKYQAVIQQEVSNTENVSISWVRFSMGVFLLINLFFLFSLFAVIHLESRAWLFKSVGLIFSLAIFALGYKGILQREILETNVIGENLDSPPISRKENKPPDQELIDKVVAYMNDKKPFLHPELTLSTLARQLSMNRSQLSQLINEGMRDNFYNFVNRFRVNEVKKLMADPKYHNLSILGLALEAGFKSKSTFNLIFKRFTGLTPSEYKRNLSQ
jgi:AraC-like DNA-binding protein